MYCTSNDTLTILRRELLYDLTLKINNKLHIICIIASIIEYNNLCNIMNSVHL